MDQEMKAILSLLEEIVTNFEALSKSLLKVLHDTEVT